MAEHPRPAHTSPAGTSPPAERGALRAWLPYVAAAVVLSLALALLHRELRAHSVAQILAGLRAMPAWRLLLAAGLTALSYLALSGYDWLAARHVGVALPYRRVGFASFLGYAFANSLGFPLLTGAPVRYRLYAAWGLEGPDIARIIAFASGTFWMGFLALASVAFIADPPELPSFLSALGTTARPFGFLLLLVTLGYLAWCRWGHREIRIASWSVPTPGVGVALRQILVSAVDWGCAAAALYVLLPGGLGITFPRFLAAFLLAQILGVVSSVPGGLGVFEVTLLIALREQAADSALVSSLLAFRGVYYLVPLVLAAAALGAVEGRQRKERRGAALSAVGTGLSATVPLVLSGAVFLAGGVMLVEGALPIQGHLGSLGRWAPLAVLEASHFFGSVAGAILLILAWGLARRLDGAFHAALALLGAGAVFSAFRGGGVLTAIIPLAILLARAPARREFFRRSALLSEPLSPEWVFGVAAVLLSTAWLGLVAYRRVDYSGDLWWTFALEGDAPRFLRSAVGAAAVLLAFGAARLLRPAEPEEA
ncbi:MAG: lysylphosphatidylglycerol synthetase family protein, partial [Gemmatimonadetes bacterium]|nr:lysylphosphatidylglycerol synthetase family protein [Gemmatimonadota bacterium]